MPSLTVGRRALAMLIEANMPTLPTLRNLQSDGRPLSAPRELCVLVLLAALPLALLTGCTRSAPASASIMAAEHAHLAQQQRQIYDEARQELEQIPPPSKNRYLAVKSLSNWENPYITVQGGMITLHVTLADANTSNLGQGSMLRPVGARRQNLDIRAGELPAALNAVPQSAWPYGRVIAVEEAHDAPSNARPQIRRNMESVMRSLGDLSVVVYEWNEGGPGLR